MNLSAQELLGGCLVLACFMAHQVLLEQLQLRAQPSTQQRKN